MGFTHADPTINKERVVAFAQLVDDFQTHHARHLIGIACHQGVKIKVFIQMVVFVRGIQFGFFGNCFFSLFALFNFFTHTGWWFSQWRRMVCCGCGSN